MKYLGAVYLIYLGVSSLFLKNTKIDLKTDQRVSKIKWYTATKVGLLTNLLNPKASLFFLSLFTIVIGPEVNLTVMAILALILFSTTVLWFSLVAVFLTHQKMRYLFEENQKSINRLFGVILIIIGIRIALF
jgi:threonine/homoserine/homoserine lactone efflux protein